MEERREELDHENKEKEVIEETVECEDNKSATEELERELKTLIDENARLKADFRNYSNAVRREAEEEIKRSKEKIIQKLIDIYTDTIRAIENSTVLSNGLLEGVKLISKSMERLLADEGVSLIEPKIGEPFDPFSHEVEETISTDEVPDTAVFEVVATGYNFNGKVLRPARVIVALSKSPGGN